MIDTVRARLVKKEHFSSDICNFTFEALEGTFRTMEAGCHVDVFLGPELVRNYSVWEWDENGKSLSVAVKREDSGRGGSIAMHDLEEGVEIELGGPRNNFPLTTEGQPIVLVGGGIGVTPIFSMASELKRAGRDVEVYYLVRSREHAAFDTQFQSLELEHYYLHCDDSDGFMDFDAFVQAHPEDTHYYVCGPEPLLERLQSASADNQRGTVYFERFAAPVSETEEDNSVFNVVINSTGESIEVPADKTILSVLKDKGFPMHYGCSSGLCGSCITDVLEGEIDHRDNVLDEDEQAEGDCMCICVSRAKSATLLLDI